MRSHSLSTLVSRIGALALIALALPVAADERQTAELGVSPMLLVAAEPAAFQFKRMKVGKDYALGIRRFDLDTDTEIIGWQLSQAWYLGRQDGLDSGLTLVWQGEGRQFSVSKDGLRLTKRF